MTKNPGDFFIFKRSVCSEDVQQQSEWKDHLRAGGGMDLTIDVTVGFQQRDRL